ncbi:MAG: hypothetical protein AAF732_02820 [Pseudomonadota bacterium]
MTARPDLTALTDGHHRLMQLLSEHVDDGMLHEMATADYGFDVAAHLAALKRIRARDQPPKMHWEPKEVLELTRWSEICHVGTDAKPSEIYRFHLMRAFASAALIEAYAQPGNHDQFEGTNASVMQLLESAEALGHAYEACVPAFLAWASARINGQDEEHGFYYLAILWGLLRNGRNNDLHIHRLADGILDEEIRVRETWPRGVGGFRHRLLLGLTHFDMLARKWERLAGRLNDATGELEDQETREMIFWISYAMRKDNVVYRRLASAPAMAS